MRLRPLVPAPLFVVKTIMFVVAFALSQWVSAETCSRSTGSTERTQILAAAWCDNGVAAEVEMSESMGLKTVIVVLKMGALPLRTAMANKAGTEKTLLDSLDALVVAANGPAKGRRDQAVVSARLSVRLAREGDDTPRITCKSGATSCDFALVP